MVYTWVRINGIMWATRAFFTMSHVGLWYMPRPQRGYYVMTVGRMYALPAVLKSGQGISRSEAI